MAQSAPFFMRKLLILILLSSFQLMAQSEEILLYPSGAPGLIADHGLIEENMSTKGDGIVRLRNISEPSLRVYRPKEGRVNGTSVIICPGGGYSILAINHEGYNFGEWFAERGITAFVLKNRLPQAEMFSYKEIRPLEDAQTSISYLRTHAAELNIDPDKIGIMGFSAGGHLAATASTLFDWRIGENEKTEVSLRPDFSILVYPVISFNDKFGHSGSRGNLIGPDLKIKDIERFSNELQVTKRTPPAFLVHAYNDPVKMENSLAYVTALRAFNIPAELHLFEKGGHGFGMGTNEKSPVAKWTDRLEEWLVNNKLR
ncbi:MAG: acetyl esterase/lipase [Psychromonas sp.]|jgi:acetyl esterase/lipase